MNEARAMNEALVDLGRFVRERRKANGLTQSELALLAGVGRRFVSELENGKPSLQVDKVDTILRVFGMQLGVVPRRRPTSPISERAVNHEP
jgi:y4mF family transcriptional regulator